MEHSTEGDQLDHVHIGEILYTDRSAVQRSWEAPHPAPTTKKKRKKRRRRKQAPKAAWACAVRCTGSTASPHRLQAAHLRHTLTTRARWVTRTFRWIRTSAPGLVSTQSWEACSLKT